MSSSAGGIRVLDTWCEYFTPEGYPYYFNTVSGETTWEAPSEFPSLYTSSDPATCVSPELLEHNSVRPAAALNKRQSSFQPLEKLAISERRPAADSNTSRSTDSEPKVTDEIVGDKSKTEPRDVDKVPPVAGPLPAHGHLVIRDENDQEVLELEADDYFEDNGRSYYMADEDSEWGVPKHYVLGTRVLVCAIAVALIWCTSLSLSAGIAAFFITSPNSNEIFRTWDVTYHIAREEKHAHELCADEQIARCNTALNTTAYSMKAASEVAQARNTETVAAVSLTTALCQTAQLSIFTSTQKWIELSPTSNILRYLNCSAADQANLRLMFGDVGQVANTQYSLNELYARQQEALLAQTAASINNWTLYNQQYFGLKGVELSNVALNMEQLSLPTVQLINMTLPEYALQTGNLTACIVQPAGCPWGRSVVAQYHDLELAANKTYKALSAIAQKNYQT